MPACRRHLAEQPVLDVAGIGDRLDLRVLEQDLVVEVGFTAMKTYFEIAAATRNPPLRSR